MLTSAWRAGDDSGRPGWTLVFGGAGFEVDKIEALKAAVPARHRRYNPETHHWWVSLDYEDAVERIFPGFESYRRQGSLF